MTSTRPMTSGHRWPYWLAGAAAALVATLVVLCAVWFIRDDRAVLTERNVVGTWRASDGAEIAIGADQRFTARRLAAAFFMSLLVDEASEPQSGAGVWRLERAPGDPNGPTTKILLDFRTMGDGRRRGPTIPMTGDHEDGELILFVFIGDPGQKSAYSFARVSG